MDAAGGREQAAGPEDVEPGLQSRRYQGWPELKFRAHTTQSLRIPGV